MIWIKRKAADLAPWIGNRQVMMLPHTDRLVGNLHHLGMGRIIARCASLAIARRTDFSAMDPAGRYLPFAGGEMNLDTDKLRAIASHGICSKGLTVSLIDETEQPVIIFDFSQTDEKRTFEWWVRQQSDAIASADHWWGRKPLCWCELWPQAGRDIARLTDHRFEERFADLVDSGKVIARLQNRHLDLTTSMLPACIDTDESLVRFWDRPRTQVCYADMESVHLLRDSQGRLVLWNGAAD